VRSELCRSQQWLREGVRSGVCRSRRLRPDLRGSGCLCAELRRSGLLRQRLRQRLRLQEELLEVPEAVHAEVVPAEVPPAKVELLQEELLRWLCENLRPDVRRSRLLCSDLRCSRRLCAELCRSGLLQKR